ncbi:MAG: hypothetical protein JO356_20340, partial [Acidobacteria bacterium]|nr:hypothetical protein [Acidobacteriota bacterium]
MTITTDRAQTMSANAEQHADPWSAANLEGALTLAAGAALTGLGIWRRGWIGAALASGGACLLFSGSKNIRRPYQGSVRVAMTIGREREEIYDFVSNAENWPKFLASLRIDRLEASRLSLVIGQPPQLNVDSYFRITDHKAGEYVAWASEPEVFEHRGVIHFRKAPGDRGSEISVALEYKAPTGPLARSMASLVGWNPEQVVRESLRRLKQLLEAGEIPTTEGQPVGARGTK